MRPFKLFVFIKSTKSIKAQNANKRISNFFSLRCFLCVFFLSLFAVSGFVLVKSYYEKKNKTALITSFILLLRFGNFRVVSCDSTSVWVASCEFSGAFGTQSNIYEHSANILNGFQPLNIFAKSFNLHIR